MKEDFACLLLVAREYMSHNWCQGVGGDNRRPGNVRGHKKVDRGAAAVALPNNLNVGNLCS